jgi:hypothetical protein
MTLSELSAATVETISEPLIEQNVGASLAAGQRRPLLP